MIGVDSEAQDALEELQRVVAEHEQHVVLEAGDLLVVDNNVAVHGRSPFTPRFDGTDRWLQRTFVVTDLAPSAADRNGRIITTDFAN
jgi:alpha-ketoglutarate-dependent taurine dioxygenase